MPRRLPRRRRWVPWFIAVAVLYLAGRLLLDVRQPKPPQRLDEGRYAVAYVVDGDTIQLTNDVRVRLIGIDTPETHSDDSQPERWSAEATDFTRHFLRTGRARLRFDRERIDRYGRFLAYVYVDDQLLNEALLRAGLARARTGFNYADRFKRIFREAENEARQTRRGIWSDPSADL